VICVGNKTYRKFEFVSTYSGKYKTLAYKGFSRGAYGFKCPEDRNISMQI